MQKLDRDQLYSDKKRLKALFGLLIVAHYQTTPGDLRSLLDGPNMSVWVIEQNSQLLAAALVSEEGDFEDALAESIWRGQRRPRGHLLPQTLSFQAGFRASASFRFWRVVRIAVDPQWRRRGLGKRLLAVLARQARDQQCDFIGSSFAASAEVVDFWNDSGCVPVHLGNRRDTCSGYYSVVVVSALSAVGAEQSALWQKRFAEQFSQQLLTTHDELEPLLVASLLAATDKSGWLPLSQQDWLDASSFVDSHRHLASCQLALRKLLLHASVDALRSLDAEQLALLVPCLLQGRPIDQLTSGSRYSGKKALLIALRNSLAKLLKTTSDSGFFGDNDHG